MFWACTTCLDVADIDRALLLPGAALLCGDRQKVMVAHRADTQHRRRCSCPGTPRSLRGNWRRSGGVLVNVRPQSADVGNQNPLVQAAGSVPQRWPDHLQALGAQNPGELRILDEPLGYVHTPSLPEAVTVGVLRGSEAVHASGGTSLARIDLTSKRVRTALRIVDACCCFGLLRRYGVPGVGYR